jgi:AraC-like DNA-binding protein
MYKDSHGPGAIADARPTPSPREFQEEFLSREGVARQIAALFEYLPDTDFFAKDTEGRFVAVSRGMLRRVGLTNEEELLGVSDSTIHPHLVARAIREDDLQVMRTGQPIVDRVEALYARTRAKDWFLTTKLPLYGAAGAVIGVMGFVRPYFGTPGTAGSDAQIQRVVAYIHEHYRERMPVEQLARIASMSDRQLNRRFQETFRMSVQEFIIRTRIQAASDDLRGTENPVAEIAQEHGFYDQSAFTKMFRVHTGETPQAFRQRRSLAVGV